MKRDAGSAAGEKNPAENPQARAMSKLRDQLEVTDDAEWEVIAERINRVIELRQNVSGGAGLRGVPSVDKAKRNGQSDTGRPGQDSLRTAVRDRLPDAEIKSRLALMHAMHEQTEARLAKAQEELRSVLSIRQEAVAVVSGLLPP